jgi:hypothetical protein
MLYAALVKVGSLTPFSDVQHHQVNCALDWRFRAHMYVSPAVRDREFGTISEIAHMYPAC